MFKIVSERRVWWPVVLQVPMDDGAVETVTFRAQFRMLPVDEAMQLLPQAYALGEDVQGQSRSQALAEIAAKFINDWSDVEGDQGSLPYSFEALRQLLNIPRVFEAVLEAYQGCINARVETRSGN